MIFRRFPATQSAIVPDPLLIIPRVLPTRAPRVRSIEWVEGFGKKNSTMLVIGQDTGGYKNKMLHRFSSILRNSNEMSFNFKNLTLYRFMATILSECENDYYQLLQNEFSC